MHEDIRFGCADFAFRHNEPVPFLCIEEFHDPARHFRNARRNMVTIHNCAKAVIGFPLGVLGLARMGWWVQRRYGPLIARDLAKRPALVSDMASTIGSLVIVAAVITAIFQRMIVWIVQWARDPERRSTKLDLLGRDQQDRARRKAQADRGKTSAADASAAEGKVSLQYPVIS